MSRGKLFTQFWAWLCHCTLFDALLLITRYIFARINKHSLPHQNVFPLGCGTWKLSSAELWSWVHVYKHANIRGLTLDCVNWLWPFALEWKIPRQPWSKKVTREDKKWNIVVVCISSHKEIRLSLLGSVCSSVTYNISSPTHYILTKLEGNDVSSPQLCATLHFKRQQSDTLEDRTVYLFIQLLRYSDF